MRNLTDKELEDVNGGYYYGSAWQHHLWSAQSTFRAGLISGGASGSSLMPLVQNLFRTVSWYGPGYSRYGNYSRRWW